MATRHGPRDHRSPPGGGPRGRSRGPSGGQHVDRHGDHRPRGPSRDRSGGQHVGANGRSGSAGHQEEDSEEDSEEVVEEVEVVHVTPGSSFDENEEQLDASRSKHQHLSMGGLFFYFYIGMSVATAAISGVIIAYAGSYYLAYTDPMGDVTEEQEYLLNLANHSWWAGCAGVAFGAMALVVEFFARDADAAKNPKTRAKESELYRPGTLRRIRLGLALLAAGILAAIFLAYAVKMWRNGTNPMITVKRRVRKNTKSGHKFKWVKTTLRKTCEAAKRSHCDKLEDLGNSLIGASVIVGVFFMWIGVLAYNTCNAEKFFAERFGSSRSEGESETRGRGRDRSQSRSRGRRRNRSLE